MRYVIVDLDGAAREHLSNRADLRDVLREVEADTPGIAAELYVLTYDAYGDRVGEAERGDELLAPSMVICGEPMIWGDPMNGSEDAEDATWKVVAGASR
jgi:hypothetical protein